MKHGRICLLAVIFLMAGCAPSRMSTIGRVAVNADDDLAGLQASVVGVTAYQTIPQGLLVRTRDFVNPFPLRSFIPDTLRFVFYFPRIILYPFPSERLGSGFVIDEEGHIITSYHIVEDYNVFYVRMFDGSQYEVTLVGQDPLVDIALLRLDTTDLPPGLVVPARLGDSDRVRQGESLMAIGYPFGLSLTTTLGIVSGIGRRIGVTFTEDLFQVDTPLNPGNSGGPLLNADGEVMAVAEAAIWLADNKGFAIPINMVTSVLNDLKAGVTPQRGRIGIAARNLTLQEAALLNIENRNGAIVAAVEANSPAGQAGLRVGDVITRSQGAPLADVMQLVRTVRRTRPGNSLTLTVLRITSPPENEEFETETIEIEMITELIREPFRIF